MKAIESRWSAFLWSGSVTKTKQSAKVKWLDVCLTKEEGGLGLKHIYQWNLIRLLLSDAAPRWIALVKAYISKWKSFWQILSFSSSP